MDEYHCLVRAGSERILATMRGPESGGFEDIGRIRILICDSVRAACSLDSLMIEKRPTRSPYNHMFLEND